MHVFGGNKFKGKLLREAEELGITDAAENELISTFVANYDFYQSILERALSDGIISVDEKVELYKYRASIIAEDLKIMNRMDQVRPEDAKLLNKIVKLVDEMRLEEEQFASLV